MEKRTTDGVWALRGQGRTACLAFTADYWEELKGLARDLGVNDQREAVALAVKERLGQRRNPGA